MIGIATCEGGRAYADESGRIIDESGAHGGFGPDAAKVLHAIGGSPHSALGEAYTGPIEASFSPYEFNGGTILAVAGDDFVVLGADTRLSMGYNILSRRVSKAVKVTSTCVIGSGGCYTDIQTLHKNLQIRSAMYKHDHACEMGSAQVAQLLSTTLYHKRFFPYYAFNIVAGIDANGSGVVYTYDAIGSFEPKNYAAQGSGQKLIIPVLDNLVGHKNRLDVPMKRTLEDTVELVKDSFITAGERQINTGDAIELFLITKTGIETRVFELKKD
jgi:20S proteasome subunit beta 6